MTRKASSICFDTTPLIWGVRGESARGQEHEIERTKKYIKHIKQMNNNIMVPVPVLAEYLIGADATEFHEKRILTHHFQYPSLDVASATLAAELQRGNAVRMIQDDFGIPRECVKTDALVIAIAILNHAILIITNDEKHFRVLAAGRIPISCVPDVDSEKSTDMFGYLDEENSPNQ